ncbi:conserved exported hypothetical protein [Cupriavidus taiwanensis]|uniref:DUF4410 domain-containing protein n=1 Tax=Cupriavidus taiwanensis TaxID=164546 RepID=A0A975XGE7_9BURK|nr:DUF4410 domain-containing protein [Cupriavidus taiwanensis]SOY69215.1 conserved exported hypothetical protein [Cupriavidus taiwanensis]
MRNTIQTIARHTKCLTIAALAATAMLSAGCASAGVTGIDQTGLLQPVHADIIYVRAFGASAAQVRQDSGLAQQVKRMVAGGSPAGATAQAAAEAREQVAGEIVRELRARGLHAVRSDAPVPAGASALVVDGDFSKIDEGTARRRLLIGLGAGKSEVSAAVRITYQPAHGAPVPLQSFVADADSGHLPGVAETAGIGAAAGHLAMAAGAGAGLHGVSAIGHDAVYADATRLGNTIAAQVVAASTGEGWLTAAAAI